MANLAVVPLVQAVDTFWVGRMGNALAQAGQSAAGTTFFTVYFLVAFVPTMTAPLVAAATGRGDSAAAEARIGDAVWVSTVLGLIGTLMLTTFPSAVNSMVVPRGAPAAEFADSYLRLRSISMVPALISALGFAAYRGLLDTVTPLKVSIASNLVNLVLDPILIFSCGLGVAGAAVATAFAEICSAACYVVLLARLKLLRIRRLVANPPSLGALAAILGGGVTMLARQALLNLSFVLSTRRAQAIDPSGVSAAAYGIVMNIYSLGIVLQIAVQGTAAALVPATRAKEGDRAAARVADRIFSFGIVVSVFLAFAQTVAMPFIAPIFSTVPAVRDAIAAPARIAALVQLTNGVIFAGEGAMIGLGAYKALATVTGIGVAVMAAVLTTPVTKRLDGILLSILAFHIVQAIGVLFHHLRISPLRPRADLDHADEKLE